MEYNEEYLMKDFYERTFKLLDQYSMLKEKLNEEYYDITLLVNCLFGIIIMPKSHWHDQLKGKTFPKNISDIELKSERRVRSLNRYNVLKLFTDLRNSLAHWGDMRNDSNYGYKNLEFKSKKNEISGLSIVNLQENFEIHFKTVESLRGFLEELRKITAEL